MHNIRILFDLIIAAILAYIIWVNYRAYVKQTAPDLWGRLLGMAKDSATVLWSQFCMALACVVGELDSLADLTGMPEVKTFIDNWLGNPKIISGVMLAIAFISFKARMRSGSSNPVE